MNIKTYKFNSGFTITMRMVVGDVFFAMGDDVLEDAILHDVRVGDKLVGSYELWDEAKEAGIKLSQKK